MISHSHSHPHTMLYLFALDFKIVFSILTSFTLIFKQNKHTRNLYFHRIWFNVNKTVPLYCIHTLFQIHIADSSTKGYSKNSLCMLTVTTLTRETKSWRSNWVSCSIIKCPFVHTKWHSIIAAEDLAISYVFQLELRKNKTKKPPLNIFLSLFLFPNRILVELKYNPN